MKKTKYLVLSAAAILAVGCGGTKMVSIDADRAENVGAMIDDAHDDLFPSSLIDYDETIANWSAWKMKNLPHQVTIEQKETHHYATRFGTIVGQVSYPEIDTLGHNTRVVKYDVDAQRVSYRYDADYYEETVTDAVLGDHVVLRPGKYNYYVDFAVKDIPDSTSKALYIFCDWNGTKWSTMAYFESTWGAWGGVACDYKEAIDAFIKYAYANASYFAQASWTCDYPIPSAAHYLVGRDDDAEEAFDALIEEDFTSITVDDDGFDKWATFGPTLVAMKDGYDKTSKQFTKRETGLAFSSEAENSDNSLGAKGNFDLVWETDAHPIFGDALYTYGIDFEFEYHNNMLSHSKTYAYTRTDGYTDNKVTGFYGENTIEKEVTVKQEAKGFEDLSFEAYPIEE